MAVEVINHVPEQMEAGEDAIHLGTEYVADALVDSLGRTSPKGESRELSASWSSRRRGPLEHEAVSSADHWAYAWKGTGEYVGNGPIKPKTAKALKFEWDGRMTVWKGDWSKKQDSRGRDMSVNQQKFLFARWAESLGFTPFFVWPKGIPGTPYVEEAMEITERRVEGCYERALMETGAMD